MTQTITAKELLAQIEKRYFKGAGLAKASKLESDERRAFVLAQVERLLTEKHGSALLAMWLSDEFWTADEGRKPIHEENPLLSLKEKQTLTDREMGRLRLILEVAGLCHDLVIVETHFALITEAPDACVLGTERQAVFCLYNQLNMVGVG